jgi:hypothetical protein
MSRANFERLGPPPRHLPAALRLRTLCGSSLALSGWFVLALSTPFFWGFAMNADVLWPLLFRTGVTRVEGRVLEVAETGASANNVSIYSVAYAYRDAAGVERSGRSYSSGQPRLGAPAAVEYLSLWPQWSRIEGLRRGMFGPGALVVLAFPGIGVALVGIALRSGRKTLRLLAHGQIAQAQFVSDEATNLRIDDRPVVGLNFEFTASDGQRHSLHHSTSQPAALRDERRESVLYDPEAPDDALLVDQLPDAVAASEQGELVAQGRGGLWAGLIPFLTLLMNGGCVVREFLR